MISGKFTVTTLPELKALVKLGVPTRCSDGCEISALSEGSTGSAGFTMVRRVSNDYVSGWRMRVHEFRVRRGVPQFSVNVDGKREWVTAAGTWSIEFDRKNPGT